MYPLDKDDCLNMVTRYELFRDGEQFHIDVHCHLAGFAPFKYSSCLYDQDGKLSNICLTGQGNSEIEALRALLTKIQGRTAADLDQFFVEP